MIHSKPFEKSKRCLPEEWPAVMAHRGASTLAPENSLAAFALARKLGSRGIELDVHLCLSGELVVTHDHWLDRIAGIHRRIEDMHFQDIAMIDSGSFFNRLHPENANESFSRERIPTLDMVLETAGPDMYFDIELKMDSLFARPLAEAVARCLRRHNRLNCIVSSFDPFVLLAYRRFGNLATAAIYSTEKMVPFFMRHRECLYISGAEILKPSYETFTRAIRTGAGSEIKKHSENKKHSKDTTDQRIEAGSKPVIVWTVDTFDEAKRLLSAGARTIITNRIQDFL